MLKPSCFHSSNMIFKAPILYFPLRINSLALRVILVVCDNWPHVIFLKF